ncbi:hypothetical protein NIES4075_71440 [Tolypothrix sp. NIES-4075]|nr:hypothetical protein NIES4075_71440 [Tolypothrix sp. NIES-4075]
MPDAALLSKHLNSKWLHLHRWTGYAAQRRVT